MTSRLCEPCKLRQLGDCAKWQVCGQHFRSARRVDNSEEDAKLAWMDVDVVVGCGLA